MILYNIWFYRNYNIKKLINFYCHFLALRKISDWKLEDTDRINQNFGYLKSYNRFNQKILSIFRIPINTTRLFSSVGFR